MKFVPFTLSIVTYIQLCAAWDCDPRCAQTNAGAYIVCVNEEAAKDGTVADKNDTVVDKNGTVTDKKAKKDGNRELEMDPEKYFELKESIESSEMSKSALFQPHPNQMLRGTHQRQLETINFQLKMYHEPGYCWQGEWEDREWCAQCINECEESDYLELQNCKSKEVKQHFTYEPMPDGIGGRIKPLSNTSLCWERTRARAHQLSPCDDITGIVNVTQIFRDVDMWKPFELHPYTRGDQTTNPNGPMCLTSEHYPKRAEVLRAENCVDARLDKSSFWVAYNAYNEVGDTLLAPVEIQKEPPTSSPTTLPSAAPSVPSPAPTIPPSTIPPAAYTNEAVRWTIAPSESPGQHDEPTETTESRKFPQ